MEFLDLPKRTSGTRTYGITSIVDFGVPLKELESILDDYGHIIDIAKLGIGSAYVTPNVQKKQAYIRSLASSHIAGAPYLKKPIIKTNCLSMQNT